MRSVRKALGLVVAVACASLGAGAAAAPADDTPDFSRLAGVADAPPSVLAAGDLLRVTGTVTAGRHDPAGKNEYYLALLGARDRTERRRCVVGPSMAQVDIGARGASMAHGQRQAVAADLSLAMVRKFKYPYVALAWMERDLGLGIGSLDTPILFMLGGAPDEVASTAWLSVADLARGPTTVELGPTRTGGRLSLVLEVVPAPR